ncbi:unnamed protein product [Penicillium olsonii]|nr:unnamed protein product [Penicillium olsonii]
MGSQGFSFPPPPPPPPTQQPPAYPPTQHGQNWGGRGGAPRGRGRGQGHRGRGGHAEGARTPSYPPPGGFNYGQTTYAGYPSQPVHAAPYMPPAPYPHGQSQGYQNPPGSSPFPNAQYPQPGSTPSYQHLPYNAPANQAPSYQPTPSYMQGLPAPHHGHQPNSQAVMGGMPWGNDMQGQYMGAQSGQARGPRPNTHNHGPKGKMNHKRDHASAFTKPQSTIPRPPTAPAVPSFGNPLPSKPPPAADATGNRKTKKRKRKHNQLGLTPNADDHDSSEEDEAEGADEETKLAQAGANPGGLQVSYKGKTSNLGTPAEIAAWIAERKKNFPTQARIAAKQKAAEEAKAAREAARQKKTQEQQAKRKENRKQSGNKQSENKQSENSAAPADSDADAKRREEIRRNLEQEQERIAKAMAEADAARLRLEALQKEALGLQTESVKQDDQPIDQPPAESQNNTPPPNIETELADVEPQESASSLKPDLPASSEDPERLPEAPEPAIPIGAPSPHDPEIELANEGSDWTSSDGSDSDSESHSDSDSAPEQASSRRTGPDRVPPPPREGKKAKSVCRYFSNGKCRNGDQCSFSHDTPGPKAKAEKKSEKETRRKGLFQALLDRQKDDEDRRAMEVIAFLGQHNLLVPDTNTPIPH